METFNYPGIFLRYSLTICLDLHRNGAIILFAIETNRLTKYYGKTPGIRDLNLQVEEGDVFGFIGPNGAGKSTTIRTLLNLIFPTSGSAKILGMDMIKDSRSIRQAIGYVPADIHYYEDMTVEDLLAYSRSFYPCSSHDRRQDLLERFDLDPVRKIADLSSGNRKKVAIVQSLLHQPRLLILDEPTSGLDPLMQSVFYEVIREEKERTTVFFSSHFLGEVQKMCNKIAFIRQGTVLKVDSIDHLRKGYFRTVTLESEQPLPDFSLEGIINMNTVGQTCRFLFKGDINQLLRLLAQLPVENILIEEPSLEEIFMHYYEGDYTL